MDNQQCDTGITDCMKRMKGIQDAMDVLSGKWKIRIMGGLSFGPKRYSDLQLIVEGIGPKMLSKELQDLELNGLVERTVIDENNITIQYEMTPYGNTLRSVIKELSDWGNTHRDTVIKKNSLV